MVAEEIMDVMMKAAAIATLTTAAAQAARFVFDVVRRVKKNGR